MLDEGDQFDGKYRVQEVVRHHSDGMTVVGRPLSGSPSRVLIRVFRAEMLGPDAAARFVATTEGFAGIHSDYMVRLLDVSVSDAWDPYIVTEYLEGPDLECWLDQRGSLPLSLAVDFILQACDAVASAHALGIFHRELRPASLFVSRSGTEALQSDNATPYRGNAACMPTASIKVVGWGTGCMYRAVGVIDAAPYMSPEQMRTEPDNDARSDIWSLGATLTELLTGRVPFEGRGLFDTYSRVISGKPPNLRNLFPNLPRGLEATILKCLELDRKKRHQTVAELAAALSEFASERTKPLVERICSIPRRMS